MNKELSLVEKENLKNNNTKIIIEIGVNVLIAIVVIFLVVSFSNKAYDFTYQIYGDVPVSHKSTSTKNIEIKAGESTMSIAEKLYEEKLIVNKYSFYIRLKLSQKMVKPEKYKLSNDMTYDDIIDKICVKSPDEEDE